MEFLKHKAGLILLLLCLLVIVAAVWYLLFRVPGSGGYEGGTLVEGIRVLELVKASFTGSWQGAASL